MTTPRRKKAAPDKANPERGEHEVKLEGRAYVLRPSYAAIRAIEDKTGRSIIDLARAGQTGAIRYVDAAIITTEMIRAGAGEDDLLANVSAERIGEMIYATGLPGVTARLTLALIDAATGGRTPEGEVKAAAA